MKTFPNCKINLGLHVIRRRDDWYHDLETLFLPVPLCDELEIEPADSFSFIQEGIAIDGDCNQNLVVRAYRLMQLELGSSIKPVAIRLRKNIPFGAGLGGGSSDAAFTLKMINELFGLGLPNSELRQLASRLGADCPFFIDNVPAFATGIGDCLEPLGYNPLQCHKIMLVKPDTAVSTADAYRGITPRDKRVDKGISLRDVLAMPMHEWRNNLVNDFEESVFTKYPNLGEIKNRFYSAGAIYASMSGSGSSVFGIFNNDTDIDNLDLETNCLGIFEYDFNKIS